MEYVFFRARFTRTASIGLERIVECFPPCKRLAAFFDFDFEDSGIGTEIASSRDNNNHRLEVPAALKRKVDDRIRE
jgi:hypothetical protein